MNKKIEHMHKIRAAKGCFTFYEDERKHLSSNKPTSSIFEKRPPPSQTRSPYFELAISKIKCSLIY